MKNTIREYKGKLVLFWNKTMLPFLKDPFLLNKWVRPYNERTERNDHRITYWVNSGYKIPLNRDRYQGDVFMFVEDMHLGIMPYGHRRSEGDQFTAELSSGLNRLTDDTLAKALEKEIHRYDLSESLSDFVRNVAQSLLFYGKAVYEVYCEKNGENQITELKFHLVYPPSIRKIFGTYWQVIPWSAAKHAHVRVGIRRIPSNRLLYIKFPRKLGGRRKLKKVLKELAYISKDVLPKVYLKDRESRENTSGFDFNLYAHNRYLYKGNLTRKFGWDQRKVPDNDILEYYMLYRRIRYAKSQAIIRKEIFSTLEGVLNNDYVDAQVNLETKNILKPEDLDGELQILKAGDIKFVDLLNRISEI